MNKNQASQKAYVFARNSSTGAAVTGDAANITAGLSLDGASPSATDDTNPTEVGGGWYAFDLTQAETNADVVILYASSSTGSVLVSPKEIHTGQDANVTEVAGSSASVASTPDVNVTQISGSSTAADTLEAMMLAATTGTASGTPTTAGMSTSSLTGLGDDALNNCVLIFTSGDAAKEPRRISDYTSSTGAIVLTPVLTTAPSASDAFVVTGYIEQSA